jgi:hypothetical protein
VAGGSAAYDTAYAAAALWPDAVQAAEGKTYGSADTRKLCKPDCRFPLAKTPF